MANSVHAVGRATAAFQAMGPTTGGNLICQVVHHSLSADASANDVFQLMKIPIGAVVVYGGLVIDSTNAFTFSLGDGGSVGRYLSGKSVSVSQTAYAFLRDLSGATSGIGHKYTANDTIDIKLTAVTATVNLDFTLTVFYVLDGQVGGVTSS